MDEEFLRDLEEVAEADGRYAKAAYLFLYDALQYTVEKLGKSSLAKDQRHIGGADLLHGVGEYALDRFGPLALSVLRHWGVDKTEDFGNIVFNLVDAKLMSKTENDRPEDFVDVYDFEETLDWKKRRAEIRNLA